MPRTTKSGGPTGPAKPRKSATTPGTTDTQPYHGNGNGSVPGPSGEDVAKRAYEIYQSRGGSDGADLDDWLEAERQLKSAQPAVAPAPKPRKRPSSAGA